MTNQNDDREWEAGDVVVDEDSHDVYLVVNDMERGYYTLVDMLLGDVWEQHYDTIRDLQEAETKDSSMRLVNIENYVDMLGKLRKA
jgi:hypothetical protein